MNDTPNLRSDRAITPLEIAARQQIPAVSRRQLLKLLGVAGAGGVSGLLSACSGGSGGSSSDASGASSTSSTSNSDGVGTAKGKVVPRSTTATEASGRTLVIVELRGGIDGFATLVPYGDVKFRKLRDRIWVDQKDLVMLDDRYGIPKGLEPAKDRLAFVEGVGVAKPNLSHFDMMQRWWTGDPDGTAGLPTGFFGRCCDAIRGNEAVTGVTIGGGSSPALLTAQASTVSLPQLDGVREIAKQEPNEARMRAALALLLEGDAEAASLGLGEEADRYASIARQGVGSGLELLGTLTKIGERPKRYPENNELAVAFSLVRQLISLDVGMRVFHIPWGSFDTHTNQVGSHNDQMTTFGIALKAFLDDLADNDLADRVVVATTSEFGRRAEANGNGTDHGTASTMMMAGAVNPGRHGVSPNFSKLDTDGNVKATTSMGDYYATLSNEWLGIDGEAAITGATPITGLVRTKVATK